MLSKIQLKEKNDNKYEQNFEIEFEDYITKFNSGYFNIDRELNERPLFYLMKNYKTKLNYNKFAKLFIKSQKAETIKSLLHENRFNNNNKNKNRISSLISIFNSKKIKKHKIFLEKIHSRSIIDKKYKNINSKKNVIIFLLSVKKKIISKQNYQHQQIQNQNFYTYILHKKNLFYFLIK